MILLLVHIHHATLGCCAMQREVLWVRLCSLRGGLHRQELAPPSHWVSLIKNTVIPLLTNEFCSVNSFLSPFCSQVQQGLLDLWAKRSPISGAKWMLLLHLREGETGGKHADWRQTFTRLWNPVLASSGSQRFFMPVKDCNLRDISWGLTVHCFFSKISETNCSQKMMWCAHLCEQLIYQYVADTQLYLSMPSRSDEAVEVLVHCLDAIRDWMNANKLKRNPEKTEVLLINKPSISISIHFPTLNGVPLTLKEQICSLRVLDSQLFLDR